MAGHTAAVAGKAQMLLSGSLHIDLAHIQAQYPCDICPHLRNVILQLGALGNHGHIDIGNFEAGFFHLLPHNFQKAQRIRALIGRIRIRKMDTDIS